MRSNNRLKGCLAGLQFRHSVQLSSIGFVDPLPYGPEKAGGNGAPPVLLNVLDHLGLGPSGETVDHLVERDWVAKASQLLRGEIADEYFNVDKSAVAIERRLFPWQHLWPKIARVSEWTLPTRCRRPSLPKCPTRDPCGKR